MAEQKPSEQTGLVAANAAAGLAVPSPNVMALYPQAAEWAIMQEMAIFVERSGLLPKNIREMKDPVAAATTIMLQGRELGVSMMQSLSDIYVVNGRPSCGTDLMMAMVAREGAGYVVTVEEYWGGKDPKSFITRKAVRPGRPDEIYTFTWADAVQAGLASKDVWQKFPKTMMEHRCTSILARRMWPDIVRGMYTPDEAEDIAGEQPQIIESTPAEEVEEAVFEPVAATLGEEGVKEFNETARAMIAACPSLQKTLAQDVKAYLKKEFGVDKTADLPMVGVSRVMAFIGRLVAAEVAKGGAPVQAAPPPQEPPDDSPSEPTQDAAEGDLPDEQAMRDEYVALAVGAGAKKADALTAWGRFDSPDSQMAALEAARAKAADTAGQESLM